MISAAVSLIPPVPKKRSDNISRQKAGSLGFERDRRPGALSLDIDFAENGNLEEAQKAQSEHWSTDL